MPRRSIPPFEPSPKLFQVLKESILWGDLQGIDTVGALNDMVTKRDMREVVLVQEAYQERKIAEDRETDRRSEKCQICVDRRTVLLRQNDVFP